MTTKERFLLLLPVAASGLLVLPQASVSGADLEGRPKKLITNSIGIKLVLVPAGEFLMGSPDSDRNAYEDERPQHPVKITRPFYLGVTEVTQEQYERVMDENPSKFEGDPQRPVETVRWKDAVEFCRRLSEKEGKTYRLPTECQWEYACRAGSTTRWCFGDSAEQLPDYAWYAANLVRTSRPVGQKKPNAWGLYDMHGNLWEWCSDWYDRDYYRNSPRNDPAGPSSSAGLGHVVRGGCWSNLPRNCRSAVRHCEPHGWDLFYQGFRVSLVSVAGSGN